MRKPWCYMLLVSVIACVWGRSVLSAESEVRQVVTTQKVAVAPATSKDDPLSFLDNGKFKGQAGSEVVHDEPGFMASLLKMMAALALVLGLIVGAAFGLKKLSEINPRMRQFVRHSSEIAVVGRHSISKKLEVLIIRVRDRDYILAQAGDHIQVIDRMSVDGRVLMQTEAQADGSTKSGLQGDVTNFDRLMSFIGKEKDGAQS